MSIVRVGLAETKNFSEGYEAIFGKKKDAEPAKEAAPQEKTCGTTCGTTCGSTAEAKPEEKKA